MLAKIVSHQMEINHEYIIYRWRKNRTRQENQDCFFGEVFSYFKQSFLEATFPLLTEPLSSTSTTVLTSVEPSSVSCNTCPLCESGNHIDRIIYIANSHFQTTTSNLSGRALEYHIECLTTVIATFDLVIATVNATSSLQLQPWFRDCNIS